MFAVRLSIIITKRGEDKGCVQLGRCLVSPLHYWREVVTMKKDVPIEIEIEVVEAGQPRPQRPGPEPFGVARLRLFPGVIVRSAELVPNGKGRTGQRWV